MSAVFLKYLKIMKLNLKCTPILRNNLEKIDLHNQIGEKYADMGTPKVKKQCIVVHFLIFL